MRVDYRGFIRSRYIPRSAHACELLMPEITMISNVAEAVAMSIWIDLKGHRLYIQLPDRDWLNQGQIVHHHTTSYRAY